MPHTGICLETVDVGSEPPTEVDATWIGPDGARYLLDLLAIDDRSPQHPAVDPRAAPDFSWWWVMYTRCGTPESADPSLGIWPYPPKEYCHEPSTILAALSWLRNAVSVDGLLKREQFWQWYRPGLLYNAASFPAPFRDELDAWCRACERAQATGMKVALRVGE